MWSKVYDLLIPRLIIGKIIIDFESIASGAEDRLFFN